MGLVHLIDQATHGKTAQNYNFSVQGTPDAVSVPLAAGQIDIALLPINLAAVLYNKTAGAVQLAAVNTLGVLYIVSNDPSVTQLSDLAGRTVLNTGQGTTPQFVLDKVLASSNLSVTIDYRSQATEVASVLTATQAIAVLPEPYVTAVMSASEDIHIVADLTEAWRSITGSPLVTSCVAVRSGFAEANPAAVANFLSDYEASVDFVNTRPAAAAPLIVAWGLAPNTQAAEAAIPRAHIVFMPSQDAKTAVGAYLAALHAGDPASIGGTIPDDHFFYIP